MEKKETVFTIDLRKPEESTKYIYCFDYYGMTLKFIVGSSEILKKLFLFFSSDNNDRETICDDKCKYLYLKDKRIVKPQDFVGLNFSRKLFTFYFGNKYAVKFKTFWNKNVVFMFYFDNIEKAIKFLSILDECGGHTHCDKN